MAPSRSNASPSSSSPPPKRKLTQEEIKAAARAFALSDETTKRKKKKTQTTWAPRSRLKAPPAGRPSVAPIYPAPRNGPMAKSALPPQHLSPNQHPIPTATAARASSAPFVTHYPPSRRKAPGKRNPDLAAGVTILPYHHHGQQHQEHVPPLHQQGAQAQPLQQSPSTASLAKAQTPSPTPITTSIRTTITTTTTTSTSTPIPTRTDTAALSDLDDYELFVRSLWDRDDENSLLMQTAFGGADDDDDDEYQLDDENDLPDEEDDDVEDNDGEDDDDHANDSACPPKKQGGQETSEHDASKQKAESLHDRTHASENENIDPLIEWDKSLKEELGWLEEEDMEAAVATLLDHPKAKSEQDEARKSPAIVLDATPDAARKGTAEVDDEPTTPLRDVTRASRTSASESQLKQFHTLLERHYQLLMQQAVLAVRAAHFHRQKNKGQTSNSASNLSMIHTSENGEELAEILDGAVGMLQDLDQNRKDAIRHFVQFDPRARQLDARQKQQLERRLTRAEFTKALQEQGGRGDELTLFAVPGLNRLHDTFEWIDKSVEGVKDNDNILEFETNEKACEEVLKQAGASYEREWIPDVRDSSQNFVDAREHLGDHFLPPCTGEQEMLLRKNRALFTSGEDNLVLRGTNLYGEKQWTLISDRFLPDRSVNIISQRYSKLCVMVYKAQGIKIDDNGQLETPPKFESVDDLDEVKLRKVQRVDPPAILNVHRWSLQEDLTLLKVVPLMGNMWAELCARFLPHRDRGHVRKRYQVLERRVKATVVRSQKTAKEFRAKLMSQSRTLSPTKKLNKASLRAETSTRFTSGAVNVAAAILANAKNRPTCAYNYRPHTQISGTTKPPSVEKSVFLNPSVNPAVSTGFLSPAADNSRAAFEMLARDENEDSQMAQIEQLISKNESQHTTAAPGGLASPFHSPYPSEINKELSNDTLAK